MVDLDDSERNSEETLREVARPSCRRNRHSQFLLFVIGYTFLTAGCAAISPAYRAVSDYPSRLSQINSITLVPPLVAVFAMSSGDIEEEVQEWSDAANEHSRVAVRQYVESIGKAYVSFASDRGPRPDFRLGVEDVNQRKLLTDSEESWLLFESAKESILRHTYDITQIFSEQMKDFDYTLGLEAKALLDGTRADAFLLMIATDHVATKDRQALIGVSTVAALYTGGYGGPGMTPAELIAALVESSTGDILFFNRVSMPLSDLRDPKSNKALVDLVLKGLKQ